MKSNSFKGIQLFKGIAAAILIFLTIAPIGYVFIGSIAAVFRHSVSAEFTLSLFFKSIIINFGASLLAMLFGLLAAVCIWTFFEKNASKMALGILLLILIPPFIHVQSWIFFVDKINASFGQLFGVSPNFNGVFAVILTTAFAYLPITAGLCLVSLLAIPPELSDLCMVEAVGKKTFFKLYFPFVLPSLIIGGLLVFLLNINDYGIPSVFGVNVFALELYSRFSAGNHIYSVFLAGLPLMLLCVVLMGLFGFYVSSGNFSFSGLKGKNPFKKDKFIKGSAVFGLMILAFFILVPLCNLIYEVLRVKGLISVLLGSADEITYSVLIGILTALISFIPALLFSYFFYRSKAKIWLLGLAALPFVIPSPIAGLSLIEMWNTPLLREIYQSPVMPAIALMARFTFIEVVIVSAAISKIDKALIENMTLHYPGLLGFFKCMAQLLWRECVAAILIVFALSIGEFGVSLLVTPPGYQMLTIKIYNYLHYGASEIVAVLCLFILVITLLLSWALFLLFNGGKDE